jgi:hypothetical protein
MLNKSLKNVLNLFIIVVKKINIIYNTESY